jgi:hypothetical protein
MLRNVVESVFGVFKRRFQIFFQPSAFPFSAQVKLIYAATALHNYLLGVEKSSGNDQDRMNACASSTAATGNGDAGEENNLDMTSLRDNIAQSMWDNYLRRQR